MGISPAVGGLLGGMGGGIAQAYATMGKPNLFKNIVLFPKSQLARRIHDQHENCRDNSP
jgi:hypothetical protein